MKHIQNSLKTKHPRAARWLRLGLITLACLAGGAAALGVFALAVSWFLHNQPVQLPQPGGAYAVGRVRFDWVDASRQEVFSSDKSERRRLPVWVWYPALAQQSSPPAAYLPEDWQRARARSNGPAAFLFAQNFASIQANALEDAPLAAGPFPVLILQPGLGPVAADYTTLAEELASQGYVVVASTPAYSADFVVFADGRVVERSPDATLADHARHDVAKEQLDRLILIWAEDNRFIMNRLAELNAPGIAGKFSGKLDLDKIGVFGHSFGGASAAQTCSLDARCKAGADLDGTPYGKVIQNGVSQPFLFLWSDPDIAARYGRNTTIQVTQALVSKSTGKIYQFTISGTRHFNFSDYALEYQPLLYLMRVLGPIDGRRGLKITTDYLTAFFDQTLKGVPTPLLSGPSPQYPEVQG